MRIVEYEKDTTSVPYRVLKGLGIVAGLFAVIVCVLMIANHLSLQHTDPVHSPALERLIEQLKANPQDEALREEIRELDYLARRAFFTSQAFTQRAVYLLLGGVVVMVVAFKALEAYRKRFPYPNSKDPKDDLVANAKWARQAVTVVGLVLVGFALVLALPWKSPLNDLPRQASLPKAQPATPPIPVPAPAVVAATAKPPAQPAPAPPAVAAAPAAKPDPSAAAKPVPPNPFAAAAPVPAPTPPVAAAAPAPAAGVSRVELLKNWPTFLGPAAGLAQGATHLPVAWDGASGQGIIWKTEVPRAGMSSPIIWKNRLFLPGADEQAREVYCFDTEKGALLWRHEATGIPGSPAKLPDVMSDTGYAASTMATDGTRVFAIFANGDVVALDFEGKRLWARNLGVPDNHYGHASSLLSFEDLLLVQFDHGGEGAFFGLDAGTGAPRWRTARKNGASWASPCLFEVDGKPQVVLSADLELVSYDPRTGKDLWRLPCLEGEIAVSPLFANGLLYASADGVRLAAIDVKTQAIVWKEEDEALPNVSTPVVAGNFLIYGSGDGGIICRDAKTGKLLWHEETDEGFYASPIVAGDRVYLIDRTGLMFIFAPAAEFKSLGQPKLGEEAFATPAVIGNSLFYRGKTHLFCIGS